MAWNLLTAHASVEDDTLVAETALTRAVVEDDTLESETALALVEDDTLEDNALDSELVSGEAIAMDAVLIALDECKDNALVEEPVLAERTAFQSGGGTKPFSWETIPLHNY